MGCNATASDGAAIPVMPRDGPKGGYIMWLQSNMTYFSMGDTKLIISSDLYFDSISFDRPIFGGAYSNYTIFSSKGSLSVKEVDSADIWKTACP
jgi:hypothetical protein